MRWTLTVVAALLLAGCTSQTPETSDPATEPTDSLDSDPTPVLVDVTAEATVAWSGRTKEGAFVCGDPQGTSACQAGQQVQPDGQHTTTVPFDHNLTSAVFRMTWTPADATQTGLVLAAYSAGGTLLGTAEGTGEATLELDGAGLGPDSAITLVVWPSAKASSGSSVFLDATRQDFTVDGLLGTLDREWRVPELD